MTSTLEKLVEVAEAGDFIVSPCPLRDNEVIPVIQTNNLARQGYIDRKTPRVYIGTDLSKLIGISCPDSFGKDTEYGLEQIFYVYSPAEEYATYAPSRKEDAIANELGLEWGVTRFYASLIGCIKITEVREVSCILLGDSLFQYPVFNFKWVQIPERKQ